MLVIFNQRLDFYPYTFYFAYKAMIHFSSLSPFVHSSAIYGHFAYLHFSFPVFGIFSAGIVFESVKKMSED